MRCARSAISLTVSFEECMETLRDGRQFDNVLSSKVRFRINHCLRPNMPLVRRDVRTSSAP